MFQEMDERAKGSGAEIERDARQEGRAMTNKPKDHTIVTRPVMNINLGYPPTQDFYTYYKGIDNPWYLPEESKSYATFDEWAAYKKWEIDQLVLEARGMLRDRMSLVLGRLISDEEMSPGPPPDTVPSVRHDRVQVGGWGFPREMAERLNDGF